MPFLLKKDNARHTTKRDQNPVIGQALSSACVHVSSDQMEVHVQRVYVHAACVCVYLASPCTALLTNAHSRVLPLERRGCYGVDEKMRLRVVELLVTVEREEWARGRFNKETQRTNVERRKKKKKNESTSHTAQCTME